MTKTETAKILAIIAAAYPNFKLTEATAQVWHTLLSDLDYHEVETAVQVIVSTHTFPPSIAEVRKAVAQLRHPEAMSPAEAWELAAKAIRDFGYYRKAEALRWLPPLVARAVEAIGWEELCLSDSLSVLRAQFERIYAGLLDRETRESVLPPAVRALVGSAAKALPEGVRHDG